MATTPSRRPRPHRSGGRVSLLTLASGAFAMTVFVSLLGLFTR